jgi:hypothetical protein
VDLFSKDRAERLPLHMKYNYTIPLISGVESPFGSIYKCSPTELKTVRVYLDKNLRKGYIWNSQSQCAAPIVFAKKKDDILRICVDYRRLNKLTRKNRYSLPLIEETLDRLSRATKFSKFDVRDGYNCLRTAKGEE